VKQSTYRSFKRLLKAYFVLADHAHCDCFVICAVFTSFSVLALLFRLRSLFSVLICYCYETIFPALLYKYLVLVVCRYSFVRTRVFTANDDLSFNLKFNISGVVCAVL